MSDENEIQIMLKDINEMFNTLKDEEESKNSLKFYQYIHYIININYFLRKQIQ